MSRLNENGNPSALSPISRICFCVSGLAFIGSFACAAINQALSGWMAVFGMAGLGLFYLALGVLNLGHAQTPLWETEHPMQLGTIKRAGSCCDEILPVSNIESKQERERSATILADELINA